MFGKKLIEWHVRKTEFDGGQNFFLFSHFQLPPKKSNQLGQLIWHLKMLSLWARLFFCCEVKS